HVGEPCLRIDVIELGRLNERQHERRHIRSRSLAPIRRNHYLRKTCRIAPQIAPPPINLPGDHIPQPRHLANRSAQRKRLPDNRSLLFCAPPPASLRTRQHLNPAHRTASCTGASNSACTVPGEVHQPRAGKASASGRLRLTCRTTRRPSA